MNLNTRCLSKGLRAGLYLRHSRDDGDGSLGIIYKVKNDKYNKAYAIACIRVVFGVHVCKHSNIKTISQ